MQRAVAEVVADVPGHVAWGISIRRAGIPVAEVEPERVLPTASVGKILLLLEVARRMADGSLDPDERLAVTPDDVVGDSGLWQHLAEPTLAASSLAVLVGAVSDNLATNVLLRHVGVGSVEDVAVASGLPRTRLLDRIRDERGPQHPPAPSVGSAGELAALMEAIADGRVLNREASARVAGWLAPGVDTSMVAGALGLDPLAHLDGPVRLLHKTGWDAGVRADVGHVVGPGASVSYAVLAGWEPAAADPSAEVLAAMRAIGTLVAEAVR